jgi:hypothetical protein
MKCNAQVVIVDVWCERPQFSFNITRGINYRNKLNTFVSNSSNYICGKMRETCFVTGLLYVEVTISCMWYNTYKVSLDFPSIKWIY